MKVQYPYLYKRGSRYYFRMGVPKHLQGHFQCTEIIKSLKTQDQHEALQVCMSLAEKTKELMAFSQIPTDLNASKVIHNYLQKLLTLQKDSKCLSMELQEAIKETAITAVGNIDELFGRFLGGGISGGGRKNSLHFKIDIYACQMRGVF